MSNVLFANGPDKSHKFKVSCECCFSWILSIWVTKTCGKSQKKVKITVFDLHYSTHD